MDHDFYEWASDAPLRAPDGFSETATAAGVAASAAERNEMLAYALQTFSRGHAQLLGRILSGYEKAKKLQIRGMIGYAAAAALALVILLALPLSMDMELRVLVWLSFAGLLFIPFIPLWILLCNHVLAPTGIPMRRGTAVGIVRARFRGSLSRHGHDAPVRAGRKRSHAGTRPLRKRGL